MRSGRFGDASTALEYVAVTGTGRGAAVTGPVPWVAAVTGWVAMWLCGRQDRRGWLLSVAASLLWLGVNASLGVWAGVAASGIAAAIGVRNWLTWRPEPDGRGT